jgi:hypothetical protein
MFIKTTTHKRIVAEKDAEIAGLMKRIGRTIDVMEQANALIVDLRSRLAPFTKIGNRDSRGRFIKDQ